VQNHDFRELRPSPSFRVVILVEGKLLFSLLASDYRRLYDDYDEAITVWKDGLTFLMDVDLPGRSIHVRHFH
jgi:hypothetical protein